MNTDWQLIVWKDRAKTFSAFAFRFEKDGSKNEDFEADLGCGLVNQTGVPFDNAASQHVINAASKYAAGRETNNIETRRQAQGFIDAARELAL